MVCLAAGSDGVGGCLFGGICEGGKGYGGRGQQYSKRTPKCQFDGYHSDLNWI